MNFKSILACAALLIGIGTATAAVESDIVGYTTITMEAGKWYQVGSPFVALEEGAALKLNDVFTTGFGAGDIINIFTPATSLYVPYYWNTAKGGWTASRAPVAPLADVTLPTGQAVFINKAIAGDVLLSGKVSFNEAVEFGSEEGDSWSQIVCVYPETVKLNAITWTGLQGGDIVNVFNNATSLYVPYYWNATKGGWTASRAPVAPLVDVDIPAGQAFFINKVSAGIATCSAPTK